MKATREHGCLGENVKVHFAGSEVSEFAYLLHDTGVKYFLFTILPFIADQFNINRNTFSNAKHIKPWVNLPQWGNHVIMDSGLFSLMFGACKDVQPDEAFIRRYKDAICDFVNEHKAYSLTCVECDCQKLLGPDLAWDLRQQMRDQLPHNRIINVFHFEDGKKGLDRMIEFAEYMAISVPELRYVKPKTYRDDVYNLAYYIKNKKPEIDIHLLGCTERELLRRCKFCTSADSTSWQQINRYGRLLGHSVHDLKAERLREGTDNIVRIMNDLGMRVTDTRIRYMYNFWLSAKILRAEYARYAGNQD